MQDDAHEDPLAFEPIEIKIPEAVPAPAPPDVAPRRVLDYETLHQEQTNWCWAAVSLAVARYFMGGVEPGTPSGWSQCQLVNATFDAQKESHPDCCKQASGAGCNRPYYVYHSLTEVGHYAGRKQSGKPDYDLARTEIDAGRPFVVLVRWKGGGGHFLALYGYDHAAGGDASEALLHVGDPWYGEALVSYGSFPSTYQAGGDWGWSYWTKGTPAGTRGGA